MIQFVRSYFAASLLFFALLCSALAQKAPVSRAIREFLVLPKERPTAVQAIVNATLIDGKSSTSRKDMSIILISGRISAVGPSKSTVPPQGAQTFDAAGLTVIPGLLDSHFHLDGDLTLPALFLSHGVTSVRDPGAWIEAYDPVRQSKELQPRLFLAGPHLDCPPPAYPKDSLIVRDPLEARLAVNRLIDSGATVIKAYFRLPLELVQVVAETAHARGIPVTAHLETVDGADAIRAGIDGIEHVTSLGSALLPPPDAEAYRQAVLADNAARREGRYRVWSQIDLDSDGVGRLLKLMVERNVTLSPTLAVFERRNGDKDTTEMHVRGFQQMVRFVGLARRAGVRVVVGSHSDVPHAERGWAYQREMELLVESGLTPMEAVQAGTIENARFFRVDDRLGSIEAGKAADLVLLEGDLSKGIDAIRHIKRVMIDGRWLKGEAAVLQTK
jgi:imidazolonepropionase-like amidohydrolase